jgi:hypothetical protein
MTHYLTNMGNSLMGLVAAAITSSGRCDIHIDPEPIPVWARWDIDKVSMYTEKTRSIMMGTFFSIYVDDRCDCTDFWAEYYRLKETEYWRTFLRLSEED